MPDVDMRRYLLIETSGSVGRVGLGVGAHLQAEAVLDRSSKHTRDLLPECHRLLEEQQWKRSEIDAIAVSIGPGSYTGLRVGVMTSKAIAFALSKPLLGIPTFQIIAQSCFDLDTAISTVEIAGDAQQDRLYVQRFARTMQPETELAIVQADAWLGSLYAGIAVAGPVLTKLRSQLPATVPVMPENCWQPALAAMLQLAQQSFDAEAWADPFTLEPLYLRASSAEEQWAALGK